MKTIFVKNGEFHSKPKVLLEFPFDFQLKELVKTIPGADWKPSLKAWTIPYSDSVISDLLALFKGKAWLNYGEFKKVKLEPEPEALPALHSELEGEISLFRIGCATVAIPNPPSKTIRGVSACFSDLPEIKIRSKSP